MVNCSTRYKGKVSPLLSYRCCGLELIVVVAVTPLIIVMDRVVGCHYFPSGPCFSLSSREHHHPLVSNQLHCLVTEAHNLTDGRTAGSRTYDLLIVNPTP